jgi:hypothetical protein
LLVNTKLLGSIELEDNHQKNPSRPEEVTCRNTAKPFQHVVQHIHQCILSMVANVALCKTFFSNMAIVMGPTPPGTGVMAEATCLTPSKSTSPTIR